MKQGTGHNSMMGRKTDPDSRMVHPAGADGLDQAHGDHADGRDFPAKMTPLYGGRGYEAPSIRNTTNKCGSQGKY